MVLCALVNALPLHLNLLLCHFLLLYLVGQVLSVDFLAELLCHEFAAVFVHLLLHLGGRFMLVQEEGSPLIVVTALVLRVVSLTASRGHVKALCSGSKALELFLFTLGRVFDSIGCEFQGIDLRQRFE